MCSIPASAAMTAPEAAMGIKAVAAMCVASHKAPLMIGVTNEME